MVDVDALRKRFAGYHSILGLIEMWVRHDVQSGLENLQRAFTNDEMQTVSFFIEDGSFHTMTFKELDEFVRAHLIHRLQM